MCKKKGIPPNLEEKQQRSIILEKNLEEKALSFLMDIYLIKKKIPIYVSKF